jgi:asparagine synthetase B (glutamine-hydrolysing)
MPQTDTLSRADTRELPHQLAEILACSIDALPQNSGFALSGGYDSGALWAIANQSGRKRPDFKAYSLISPGTSVDESEIISQVLAQTGTSAHFIDRRAGKASDFADQHTAQVDRILNVPTLHSIDLLSDLMRRNGNLQHVTGLGAEFVLDAGPEYATDLVRNHQWPTLLLDAFRFHNYYARATPFPRRTIRFLRRALGPSLPDVLRRRQPDDTPPAWLHPRWHDLYRSASLHLDSQQPRRSQTAANSARDNFTRHLRMAGLEPAEQLSERYGIELINPYFHRALMDFCYALPARAINGGRHTKHLLRQAARTALGRDPPWGQRKLLLGGVSNRDTDLLRKLGPPSAWTSVSAGFFVAEHVTELVRCAHEQQRLPPAAAPLAARERHLRRYITA